MSHNWVSDNNLIVFDSKLTQKYYDDTLDNFETDEESVDYSEYVDELTE